MSAGESQDRERFAAALEYGRTADSVPAGDEPLREDLEIVELLMRSRASLAPDADASARMRATVMAAAATMLTAPEAGEAGPAADADRRDGLVSVPTGRSSFENADTVVDGQPVVDDPAPAEDRPGNVVSIGSARGRHRSASTTPETAVNPRRRGLLGVSAAAGLLIVAVTGGASLFSRDALPGDSLYGVKQTTESALAGLTSGQAKAQRQLDNASVRLDEAKQLSAQPASPSRDADISQALQEFDDQAAAGSRTRTSGGASNTAELGALSNWAQTQSGKLSAMRADLPSSAQPDADHSQRQLEDIRTRAQQLSNRQGCDSVTGTQSDQLGPLPSKSPCSGKVAASNPTSSTPATGSAVSSHTSDPTSSHSSDATSDRSDRSSSHSGRRDGDSDSDHGSSGLPTRQTTRGDDVVPTTRETPKSSGGLGGMVSGLFGN